MPVVVEFRRQLGEGLLVPWLPPLLHQLQQNSEQVVELLDSFCWNFTVVIALPQT